MPQPLGQASTPAAILVVLSVNSPTRQASLVRPIPAAMPWAVSKQVIIGKEARLFSVVKLTFHGFPLALPEPPALTMKTGWLPSALVRVMPWAAFYLT